MLMIDKMLSCDTRGHTFSFFVAVTPEPETVLSVFCTPAVLGVASHITR
jgi:hypothetical protein